MNFFAERKLKFLIISNPELFKDDTYTLSYPLVVLHSIWNYYQKGDKEYNAFEIINKIENFMSTHSDSSYIYIPKCLELYRFNKDNDCGFLLIDRSKGCYPLVFYPIDDIPEHGNRVSALKIVLDRLKKHAEYFDEILKSSRIWNIDLVSKLNKTSIYHQKPS